MLTIFLQAAGGGMGTQMILMLVIFVLFMYFGMIRPQMKKQKTEKQFQESLKVGSRVVLTSGLHGRIAQIQEDGFVIETLSGKLKFEKAAVSREFTMARFGDTTATDKKEAKAKETK